MEVQAPAFVLTPGRAYLTSAVGAAGFICMMYLKKESRTSRYDRDAIENIRSRFFGAAANCAGCLASLLLAQSPLAAEASTLQKLGLGGGLYGQAVATASCASLTLLLFAGVLRESVHEKSLPTVSVRGLLLPATSAEYQQARAYLVGPLSEEIVFRVCTHFWLHAAGVPLGRNVAFSVASFVLAHVHHLYRYLASKSFARALLVVLANCVVHSTFSLYSSYFYIVTGSLPAALVAHSLCNWMGPPSLGYLQDGSIPNSVKWQITAAYVVGITGFLYFAPRLDPSFFGSYFYA
ncbi:CAAX prenyl protease 2 [Diplonema papillatum]|nr:CAAX prenyl protease 2 [Diplonema papillatum]